MIVRFWWYDVMWAGYDIKFFRGNDVRSRSVYVSSNL